MLQQAVLDLTAERDTALARIAEMEAGETWLTEQEVDEVGKLRFDLAMKVYRMSAALKATPAAALARADINEETVKRAYRVFMHDAEYPASPSAMREALEAALSPAPTVKGEGE